MCARTLAVFPRRKAAYAVACVPLPSFLQPLTTRLFQATPKTQEVIPLSCPCSDGSTFLMQDLYSKYKFIDTRLVTSKQNLKGKLPEIKKTLEAVQYLSKKVIYEPIRYSAIPRQEGDL
jgi:hypothetical protein